jgi:hypothetical protein
MAFRRALPATQWLGNGQAFCRAPQLAKLGSRPIAEYDAEQQEVKTSEADFDGFGCRGTH